MGPGFLAAINVSSTSRGDHSWCVQHAQYRQRNSANQTTRFVWNEWYSRKSCFRRRGRSTRHQHPTGGRKPTKLLNLFSYMEECYVWLRRPCPRSSFATLQQQWLAWPTWTLVENTVSRLWRDGPNVTTYVLRTAGPTLRYARGRIVETRNAAQ